MDKKIKRFFFSNFTLIILVGLYLIYNVFAFLGEHIIGKIDVQWSLFLRGSTVILDLIIILTGIFTWLQIYLRKKIKKIRILGKERMMVILYLADTIAISIFFFFPYVARLLALLRFEKITNISFWIDFILGGLVVLFLAAVIKKITKKFNKFGKKIQKKKGFQKKRWYALPSIQGRAFFKFFYLNTLK